MPTKTVLVTGGTGFVGSNLAARLVADGHRVHLAVRPGCATWRVRHLSDDLTLGTVDLESAADVRRHVGEIRPDWIFHLAVYGAYPAQRDREQMVRTNVVGTSNLLDAAVATGCEAFVHAGSSSEYGFRDSAPAESEPADPNSAYAWTKASATALCRYVARAEGLYAPTLRLYSVYGPYEEPSRLLPTLIVRGRSGGLPPLADPRIARDFVHIDDVVDAFLAVAAHDPARGAGSSAEADPGRIYNVGTGIQTNLAEVVEIARRHLGVEEEPRWSTMENRSWDTDVWVCNNRRIAEEVGWRPKVGLAEGFARFAHWFEANPALAAAYAAPGGPARTDAEFVVLGVLA